MQISSSAIQQQAFSDSPLSVLARPEWQAVLSTQPCVDLQCIQCGRRGSFSAASISVLDFCVIVECGCRHYLFRTPVGPCDVASAGTTSEYAPALQQLQLGIAGAAPESRLGGISVVLVNVENGPISLVPTAARGERTPAGKVSGDTGKLIRRHQVCVRNWYGRVRHIGCIKVHESALSVDPRTQWRSVLRSGCVPATLEHEWGPVQPSLAICYRRRDRIASSLLLKAGTLSAYNLRAIPMTEICKHRSPYASWHG
ncbi:uncharacterized protein V1510DRAFT_406379 [Dipodascopsis tothii]|uniref:uncharacterized protein n=1 Tax=Dipodascopsis tothii TaxID=44089 RepID=UPI0034CEDE0D